MPIVCEPAVRAGELVLSIGGDVFTADSIAATARMLEQDPTENLVVIGPDIRADEAFGFAARLRVERPAAGVILLRHRVDVAMLTHALQAGIREVVPAGDRAALSAACGRSRELSRRVGTHVLGGTAPRRDGRILTVFAAKGGVGKTTLAVNLGVVLSAGTGHSVCVVDLDLAFGDVAINVQVDPARTIVDALPMLGHLDPTGASSLVTRYRPGLDLLLAPVTPGEAERIPPALVAELLTVLRTMYDYVVVDTPAQFSEHVLAAMDSSAHHILLTTPDTPALKNLRVTLDMLDMLSYPRQIRSVIVNRSDSKVGLTVEDVERVVRCPISAQIPSSRAVPVSINSGVPITVSTPGHGVSQAIGGFARQRLLETPSIEPRRSLSRRRGKKGAA